jgi:transposase-like protein
MEKLELMRKNRSFSLAFKKKAVERMKTCENVSALAVELKVLRKTLYEWRDAIEGRPKRGRPPKPRGAPPPTSPLADQVAHWKEVASQLALENHFFKQALQQTEEARPQNGDAPNARSGKSSAPSRKRKAD